MSKIIKFVSLDTTPVIIKHKQEQGAVSSAGNAVLSNGLTWGQTTAEAETIIAKAHAEAQAIIENAREIAEQQTSDAYQSGLHQGYNDGVAQGKEQISIELQTLVAEAASKAESLVSAAQQQTKCMIIDAERQIIDLSLAIARKIILHETKENPEYILPIVHAALEKVRNQQQVNIKVNPENYDLLFQARMELQSLVGSDCSVTITADTSVNHGGCLIETAYGSVDARLDTQLDMLRRALQEVIE